MNRILGIDLARFFALAGMVLVNFNLVMTNMVSASPSWVSLFEGKAAATFVVLAGLGVGLGAKSGWSPKKMHTMLKRALFLLVIGTLNMLIFPADILHYYAFYFALGIFLIPLTTRGQTLAAITITIAFPVAYLMFNYGQNWNFETFEYQNIFSPQNYLLNLSFNGWHPIAPWFAFFCVGLILSKLELSAPKTARNLTLIGIFGLILLPFASEWVYQAVEQSFGADLAILFTISPIPPGPFYVLTGLSAAFATIGLCLMLPQKLLETKMLTALRRTGQHTLTHYLAHIIIGMGIIEALGLLGAARTDQIALASFVFVASAISFSAFWGKWFKQGPVEMLMRKLTG